MTFARLGFAAASAALVLTGSSAQAQTRAPEVHA